MQSFENIKPAHRLFIFDKLQKYVLKRSNAIIAVPEEGNNIWRKAGFEGSIYQLPVGINRNTFKKINTPEYRYLKKPEEITIFYVGRLVEEKGINLLLLAFLDLLKTEEKIKLVLVGSGPQKEYLQKLSEKAKIQNSIVFLAPVVNAKIPELFSVADILVLPSVSTKIWKEQFGRVLIEAMACGVAVVGSSSGEIPNVIDKAGIIFKEGDEKDLVSALRILINSPETLNQYKKMGLQRIVEKYTWDIIMRDLSEIYNMVLKK